jgi:hypothetical protein
MIHISSFQRVGQFKYLVNRGFGPTLRYIVTVFGIANPLVVLKLLTVILNLNLGGPMSYDCHRYIIVFHMYIILHILYVYYICI